MKKNIYSVIVFSSIIILIVNVFTKSQYLTNIIVFSVNIFVKNIFPSLFPMFVISSVLVEIGFPQFLGSIFNKLFNCIFKCSGMASFVFFMSMITGFPSSAKYIDDLIKEGIIDNKEAEKMLFFTFFSNPLFIINTVGNIFLNNKEMGLLIFAAHLLGNIITGLIYRNFNCNVKNIEIVNNYLAKDFIDKTNNTDIFKTILSGIKSSLEILINIFGIVTFFLIVINTVFNTPDSYLKIFITGIIEMTTGLKYLSVYNCSYKLKVLSSTFFVSFGGLSVHAQIMDILKEKKVNYLPFLFSRIIHAIVSTVIMYLYIVNIYA